MGDSAVYIDGKTHAELLRVKKETGLPLAAQIRQALKLAKKKVVLDGDE